MSRKILVALVLIALGVIVMLLNTDPISLKLVGTSLRLAAAFAYLGFTILGIVVGLLLK